MTTATAPKFKLTRQEAREAWIAALRSGKYRQGKIFLCARGLYCCLGVASEVFRRKECRRLLRKKSGDVVKYGSSEYDLAPIVVEWLGLHNEVGGQRSLRSDDNKYLTSRNDEGASFDEIADLLEDPESGYFAGD